jgi:hypothetical protein
LLSCAVVVRAWIALAAGASRRAELFAVRAARASRRAAGTTAAGTTPTTAGRRCTAARRRADIAAFSAARRTTVARLSAASHAATAARSWCDGAVLARRVTARRARSARRECEQRRRCRLGPRAHTLEFPKPVGSVPFSTAARMAQRVPINAEKWPQKIGQCQLAHGPAYSFEQRGVSSRAPAWSCARSPRSLRRSGCEQCRRSGADP